MIEIWKFKKYSLGWTFYQNQIHIILFYCGVSNNDVCVYALQRYIGYNELYQIAERVKLSFKVPCGASQECMLRYRNN